MLKYHFGLNLFMFMHHEILFSFFFFFFYKFVCLPQRSIDTRVRLYPLVSDSEKT